MNDPSKQHHLHCLMHTNHLATNKQQNSPQSAVHTHNDSSGQLFRQHLPSYMQINPIVARSQQNYFQLPVKSQLLNHMQTNPVVPSSPMNKDQKSNEGQYDSSRKQLLEQQRQQHISHTQTNPVVRSIQNHGLQASSKSQSESSRQ